MLRVAKSEVEKMYYVYILKLNNDQYYTGFTKDLKTRVKRHHQGSTKTTKRVKPEKLVFFAAFDKKKKAVDLRNI